MMNNTIAVLPFVNTSNDLENEYFSDGITEEIINALARIENLKVISRTSSFCFKNRHIPLKEIARELNVAVILEGSVRTANRMVRISAQLIQAEDDFHFWSESWDRELENIFEIQDEISLLIAEKIREQFGHFEIEEHLVKKQTGNIEAYNYFLKARFHFNKWNPEDVRIAIQLYEKAIALDPNHTESYIGLADAYSFMATTGFIAPEESWSKSVACTQKAYTLNPEHAGVHYLLANLAFFTDCNFSDAAKHTFKSIELMPNYPEAQQYMSFLYTLSGEMNKAYHHLQLALALNPLSQETLFYKGYYHYRNGDLEKAFELFEDCLTQNPKNIPAFIVKMYCLLKQEKYQEVLTLLEGMSEDIVIQDERLGLKCLAYILMGDEINKEICFTQLQQAAQKPLAFQAHTYLFLAYASLEKYDEAFDWLEELIQMKSSIILLSFSDPLAANLKNDPRYSGYHVKLYPSDGQPKSDSSSKTPLLDEKTAEIYTNKLLDFVSQEKPFLNPNLTLRVLAQQVEIHPNQVSWLLNEQIGKNFNEFINFHRVAYFKQLAKDPANAHISLIGLAYESGFNSKTVFNTFFRKTEGITPSEFLKSEG